MKKKDLEKLQDNYYCLGYEINRNLKTYPIEKKVELAIARFDAYTTQNNVLEVIKEKYYDKNEKFRELLKFYTNKCQNNMVSFQNYLLIKINDISDSYPKKEKLLRKIKSINNTQINDLTKLPEWFTDQEWQKISLIQKIDFLVLDYSFQYLIMLEIRKKLNNLYETEKFKHNEKAFLEYDYKIMTEDASKSYERACYYYFLELPLDYPERKQIKKYILGSENLFYLPILRNLLYVGKDGPAFEGIDYALDPDSREYFDPNIYEVDTIYDILSVHTYNELIYDKIDVIDILLSQHPIFRSTVNKLPPDVFSRRRELISEIIKAEIVNYKKFELQDLSNE